jgi:hypothetical protein
MNVIRHSSFIFFKQVIMKILVKVLITVVLLMLAGISPNLFVAAQAGLASFHFLIVWILLPSIVVMALLIVFLRTSKYAEIARLSISGLAGGIIATIGLEIIRELSFRMGDMPGDLPKLMGVIMLNQFASGPDIWSNLAGWAYHFWNGASFGLIFSLLVGQTKIWQGLLYGVLIGIVFMITPVVKSLGIGLFGIEFKDGYQFATTVIISHAVFGLVLSFLLKKWNAGMPSIWTGIKIVY